MSDIRTDRERVTSDTHLNNESNSSNSLKRFQTKSTFVHRRVADSNVLISVGENIANFNGYIELNASADFLWEQMKDPCTEEELVSSLEAGQWHQLKDFNIHKVAAFFSFME
mgnify:CR=1 FL=1